ncbi:MAG: hypothetical protein ACYDEQ_09305 [Desulfocucumaceae bacterium]
MVDQILSDFTYFYYAVVICGIVGVFSLIYKKKIEKVMEETEEKSNGRSAAH